MSKYMWDKDEMKKKVCAFIDKCTEYEISFNVSETAIITTADGEMITSRVKFNVSGSFEG